MVGSPCGLCGDTSNNQAWNLRKREKPSLTSPPLTDMRDISGRVDMLHGAISVPKYLLA